MSRAINNKSYPQDLLGDSFPPITIPHRISRLYQRNREGILSYSILSPMILLFLIFSVFPLIYVIYLSFTEWNGLSGAPKWVGWANFNRFFMRDEYLQILLRTGMWGIIILFFTLIIGFMVALLLNQKIFGTGIVRTIWYLPTVVAWVVIAQIAASVLNPADGLAKTIMERIGINPPIIFQQSAAWMSFWIILLSIWKGVGGVVIIYLAGLQGIDSTLYEAAHVDGANKRQVMMNITLPSLRPITMYLLIVSIIGVFALFDPINLMTQGGPQGNTNIILLRIYQDAFKSFNLGMASASSVVVLVITLTLSILQFRISQKNIT